MINRELFILISQRKRGKKMYGCWVYPFNYEEYLKKEEEIDSLIKGFGEDEFAFDEDEFEPLDEAYIVELNIEGNEFNEDGYKGYYFVEIGTSHYDYENLDATIFGLDAEYEEHLRLKGTPYDDMTDEERDLNFAYSDKFAVLEGCEMGEEFEELMNGEDVSYGKIIKKIF